MPASDWLDLEVGDVFRLSEEGVVGTVYQIHNDDFGFPAAAILATETGGWVTVDLSKVRRGKPTLH